MKLRITCHAIATLTLLVLMACGPKPGNEIVATQPDPVTTTDPSSSAQNPVESLRNANKALAKTCFDAEGAQRTEVRYLLRAAPGDRHNPMQISYRLNRNSLNDRFEVDIKIALDVIAGFGPPRSLRNRLVEKARSCIPKVKDLFSRYGIDLILQMDEYTGTPLNHDRRVRIEDTHGRSSTQHWHLKGPIGGTNYDHCLIFAHELGHHLSLFDEYADANHPNRVFISTEENPFSIMNTPYFGWERSDFYPRHIQSILAPACSEFASAQGWQFPQEMQFRNLD